MIIIGTKEEIEAMIEEVCPHNSSAISCNDDCRTCWNRSASLVIVRPEKIGTVKKDIDGVSFLERLKEGEEDEKDR